MEILFDTIDGSFVSKKDLKALEYKIERDLRELETRLAYKLTMQLGGIVLGCTALLSALQYLK